MGQTDARSNAVRIAAILVSNRRRGEGNTLYKALIHNDLLANLRDQLWWNLTEADWNEAFNAHPRIGDVSALKQVRDQWLGWFPISESLTIE